MKKKNTKKNQITKKIDPYQRDYFDYEAFMNSFLVFTKVTRVKSGGL